MRLHQDELRVATRHHQAEQRERGFGRHGRITIAIGQPVGIDVSLDVVDPDQGKVVGCGQRLGDVDPHQQRADQARAVGDRDRVEPVPRGVCLGQRRVKGRHDPAQLLARCHLGHDPPGLRVQGHLAGHLASLDAPAPHYHRDPGLIAGRLDGQDSGSDHPASSRSVGSARPNRSRARATRRRISGERSEGVVITRASSPSSL